MTEDILFDNIYIGHSVEDAAALAAESWEIKKTLEETAKKTADVDEDEAEFAVDFKADPVAFIRQKIFTFVETAKVDPAFAVKSQPETAAGLALVATTFLGMLAVLLGLIGGQQQPITKVCSYFYHIQYLSLTSWSQSAKKTDAPSPDDKAAKATTEAAPAAPAGGEKTETPVKKRK
jgi:hypothetical protein